MLPRILAKKIHEKIVVKLMAMIFVFFTLVLNPVSVLAQADNQDVLGLQPIQDTIILGNDDIRTVAGRIINVILGLLGIIAFGLVLYGGFLIMTSAGNEEKVLQGKKVLTNAVVGLVIIMSTFAIVQFIFKSLNDVFGGQGNNGQNDGGPQPFFASYIGSGGLGSVIKDHYPRPNQVNVARNTKIAVTFAEPILPSSLISNTNKTCWPKDGSSIPVRIPDTNVGEVCALSTSGPTNGQPLPYYGDCLDFDGTPGLNLETECDLLRTDTIQIFPKSQATSTQKTLSTAAAIAVYDAEKKATVFTFKPLQYLGSDSANTWYTVKLMGGTQNTFGIKRLDGTDIFPQQFISKFYSWNFEASTTVDLTPPSVVSTRPQAGEVMARNKIIQITFNEPVDPSVTQGVSGPASNFSNIIFNNPNITGEWRISNGYRTIEFVPSEECGQNSCGEKMYCLPTTCAPTDTVCTENYSTLVRTAFLQNPADNNFVSQPNTGVMDMADNALDNGPNNQADGVLAKGGEAGSAWIHKPPLPAGSIKTIGPLESNPDNYLWNFKVKNEIDREIPYITQVKPNVEAEGVKGNEVVEIYFSKAMWYNTIPNSAGIIEYPQNVLGADKVPLEDFPYYFQMGEIPENKTTFAQIQHPREFGPGGLDLYYFTFVSSSVKGDNQNCMYPGRGPVNEPGVNNPNLKCEFTDSVNGSDEINKNCVKVTADADTDTGCVFGLQPNTLQPNLKTCLQKVKEASPSALQSDQ